MTRVQITGLAVRSAAGDGLAPLHRRTVAGRALFRPLDRFPRSGPPAAVLDGDPDLGTALAEVVDQARADAGHPPDAPLFLALHADRRTATVVRTVDPAARVYTGACVAASTALIDAASAIAAGRHRQIVVAAGYLVEPRTYALFEAGRALARDGAARPFSRARSGLLLGDALVAVVLEDARSATARGARSRARLAGWGRAGDAHHVCRPDPDGAGLARAARTALGRAALRPEHLDYVNANGAGSALGDRSEAAALHTLFGPPRPGRRRPPRPPIGATKSVHGHALEASALLELAVTVAALHPPDGGDASDRLPATAGWLGLDEDCGIRPLHPDDPAPDHPPRCALTLNAAFGGANTALVVAV
ncbi:beta-ketoacyl synthase N-terminal-like domain-containing protein [Streptomyces sp. MUM 16J]|uniref:beta-ketoacyl synthase N-terminal-like domain-containing protein n=1 Tax=Streptomyces sp. MUM 16J TaxID=2791988 RepID=UPI001F03846D|nr:beta-ketoacyl synthase N-terminal-like domain-containing protein [Streptomyces sp. MUM 16J]MCH0559334.1 beta-ketoacyl-[acyl-carrier-protein] synthase family protein [Streptomyces sp. MUM 16J]